MGSCAAPSAKGDDKFITTDYLQQCPAEESAEYIKLRGFSRSINGLADWHDYYEKLNHFARKSNIEHTVLSYISKYSPAWDDYISAIRQEIIVKAAELE
ncbi:hypothetical protein GTS12_004387 [Salmonella enterica]|nr:hypothetical protein [Salmonella enterica]